VIQFCSDRNAAAKALGDGESGSRRFNDICRGFI
jgi:hypothetical protein